MSRLWKQGLVFGAAALMGGVQPLTHAQDFAAQDPQNTVIMIGGSPEEWNFYSGYWQQLINLNPAVAPQPDNKSEEDDRDLLSPNLDVKTLSKNLVVRNLRQDFIIKLNGSSQISGTVTNRNDESVVIQGINFELQDSRGNLIQTGSAVPKPNVLAPGQTVTFSETLLTVPVDGNYRLQLSNPPFILSPGSDSEAIAAN